MRQYLIGFLFAATLGAPVRGGAQELWGWMRVPPYAGVEAGDLGHWRRESAGLVVGVPQRPAERRPSVVSPVLGGILGGGAGLVAGAFAGGALAEDGVWSWPGCDVEDTGCLLSSILVGAAIGEATALPIGAHLGGGRRWSLGLELLASVSIAAAGVAVTVARGEPAWLIPVPILQLWAVAGMERR